MSTDMPPTESTDQSDTELSSLPSGTVTFLFTDIEGSTALLQALGEEYPGLLAHHHQIVEQSVLADGGVMVETEGDGVFAAFPSAAGALEAAVDIQRALAGHPWPKAASVKVRMGLHTGQGRRFRQGYVGIDVHRAARIASAGHGGQVILSETTRALVGHSPPVGVRLRDLGEHRLKGLANPEHLYQAVVQGLVSDFPALRTLDARPHNLPAHLTSFIGREQEVGRARELLETCRLVTFTGPGGTGKTRLSLEIAAQSLDDFPNGVFFVPLGSITDPPLVPSAIAEAVGVREQGDQPLLQVLHDFFRDKNLLLVLDNFEQIVEGAPYVSDLLAAAPGLKIMVTSRETLHLSGEREFPVSPLSIPTGTASVASAEAVAGNEAVRLFVERAREACPDFELSDDNAKAVAEICARLDGLPLAMELAAARLRLFSPHELRDRLRSRLEVVRGGPRDLPARQRTLRSAIDWSYELLDGDERAILRLLSVFSQARVETVEEVVRRMEPVRDVDVVDRVASLVDKSLVRVVDRSGRKWLTMLETIWEYAKERLEEDPDFSSAARRAHAEFFSQLVEGERDALHGPAREDTLERLGSEIDNVLAAWRFWADGAELQELHRLLDPLWVLLDARGRYQAATQLAQDLLQLLSATPATPARAQEIITLTTTLARGMLAVRGYTEEVEQAYYRALSLLDEAGTVPQRFPVLRSLASFHLYRGEFDKAAAIGRELLQLAELHDDADVPDVGLRVEGHLVLGSNLASGGDAEAGLHHLDRAIALFDPQRHGSVRFRFGPNPGIVSYTSSSFFLWLMGHPDRALERTTRALELARQLDHPFTLAYTLFHVGFLDLWRRDLNLVNERASGALAVAEDHDYEVWRALALVLQGVALAGLGRPEEGLARNEEGLAVYQGLRTPPVFWGFILTLRATALALAGRPAEGVEAVDQALAMAGRGDQDPLEVNVLYPELPLLKGDLLLAATGDAGEAEPWYQQAFRTAAASGAAMSRLRAATRLVRLARQSGRGPDAEEILRPIYESFTEGFHTPDLVEARALLAARDA